MVCHGNVVMLPAAYATGVIPDDFRLNWPVFNH